MTFAVQGGHVDIEVGDEVLVDPACIDVSQNVPSGLQTLNYCKVAQVSGGNPTQVQCSYFDQGGNPSTVWIDAMWLQAVLRPQTIS